MNTAKFLKMFGLLFVVLGAVIGLVLAIVGSQEHEGMLTLMAVAFLVMFCGIGGFFAWYGNNLLHRDDEIVAKGANYLAKVFGYEEDHSLTMNGAPVLVLVVRYFEQGEIRQASVNTGVVDKTLYPIGSTVTIRVYEGRVALVPGSCSSSRIEGEDDLMNPDFDPLGIQSSVNVDCPNCGASIVVPLGMSRICPYCNTKVSIDEEGNMR